MPPKDDEIKTVDNTVNEEKHDNVETSKDSATMEPTEESSAKVDSSKLVDKLQKRLTKEQADKNEWRDKFEEVSKELEKLKNANEPKKSVTEIRQQNKAQAELETRDKRIAELEAQIKRADTLKEVNGIFKDADLNVSDDILNLVVASDSETTVSNAKAVIDLVNQSFEDGRKEILKGRTPKVSATQSKPINSFNDMTLLERVELKKNDPERYQELIRGFH